MVSDKGLLQVLRIAHRTSMRGAGVSLHQALADSDYRSLRPHFNINDLRQVIDSHPELTDQWIGYSEDKRTTGGWYINASSSIIGSPAERAEIQFRSMADAVSAYVIRELDFWVAISAT